MILRPANVFWVTSDPTLLIIGVQYCVSSVLRPLRLRVDDYRSIVAWAIDPDAAAAAMTDALGFQVHGSPVDQTMRRDMRFSTSAKIA